mmetsp:Transcript_13215/g.21890  ORF Transcript_13215/g.21890 Transcript_13215/m.21890 type:complete len:432 (+) Transcript_13215:253-1548(+)
MMNSTDFHDSDAYDVDDRKGLPTFYGNTMPTKVSLFDDDDEDEGATRKMQFKPFLPPSSLLVDSVNHTIFAAPSKAPSVAVVATTTAKYPRDEHPSPLVVWNVENVPIVPKFHPLERTSILVPDTPPSIIGERIVAVLQARSIHARFHNFKATCLTPEEVDFRIFVYYAAAGSTTSTLKQQGSIIVEVQRRFGNSMNYYHHVRAILDAAQGKAVHNVEQDDSGGGDVGPPPLVNDDHHHHHQHVMSLEFVSKMLDLPTTTTIGFQTLMSLTDASKMGATTSNQVAHLLWESDVGYKVVQFLMDDEEKKYKSMALVVLGNALSRDDGRRHRHHEEASLPPLKLIVKTLLPFLLKEIQHASTDPHSAFLAVKCLEPLVLLLRESGHHHDAAHDVEAIGKALKAAVLVGQVKHADLASQAQHCLERMGEPNSLC